MTTPFGPWVIGFRGQVLPLVVFADIISDNWDGAIPPNLPDIGATEGYALQADIGAAQFNGFVIIGEGGTLSVGGPAPAGGSSQFFVTAPLEHIVLIESEDVDDNVAVIDINDDIFRVFWYAPFPTPIRALEIWQDGTIDNQGAGWARMALPAYTYKQTVQFTASGTFTKSDYDGIRAIHYRVQAGGGGSGGCAATAAGQVSQGGNGGGGEYVEGFILESDLAASEAVTVGAGGANGAAGNNAGGAGGDSVIDTIPGEVRANGGAGGGGGAATVALTGVGGNAAPGGSGGGGTGAYLVIGGDDAGQCFTLATNRLYPGNGGGSAMGPAQSRSIAGGNYAASPGRTYGGGAQGGGNDPSQAALAGADGAAGIVLIDVLT